MKIINPVVNLNGTSREELVEQRRKVHDSLRETLSMMALARPHGRDFQTAPAGLYEAACRQHEDNMIIIRDMAVNYYQSAVEIHTS